jgi:hypothetical protein
MTILRPFGFAAGVLRQFAKTGTASAKPLSKLRIEKCVDASKVAKRFEVNRRRLNLSFITMPKLPRNMPLSARQWKAFARSELFSVWPKCMDRLHFATEDVLDSGTRWYVSGLLVGSRAVALMGIRTRLWSY